MPEVIDLFSGVGGLSLGAERSGFKVRGAIENDVYAISSHKKNFPHTKHLFMDIGQIKGNELITSVGLKKNSYIDGLIGGPPCQGFSNIGKRNSKDPRNSLFVHFFRLVNEIKPSFFLVENVPGILDKKFSSILEEAFGKLTQDYRILNPMTLKANEFGVPTTRPRVFFYGYLKKSIKKANEKDFMNTTKPPKTFVAEALEGLPEYIDPYVKDEEYEWKFVSKMTDSFYAKKICDDIPERVGDQNALNKYLKESLVSGCMGTKHSKKVIERYNFLEQGQKDEISRSVRLKLNDFSPTIRSGTFKDKGSFQAVRPIHPIQPRVITPREAARLQGFPDWFIFHKTKWHSFRQIGGSVSPILAEQLLKIVMNKLIE